MELFPSGLGIHHAGMLRKHRTLMERAFEKGFLKVGDSWRRAPWLLALASRALGAMWLLEGQNMDMSAQ